jgi:putative transposase
MPYRSEQGRKPTRMAGRDYSRPGWYFVTICTHYHAPIFGDIHDGVLEPNAAGSMVEREWQALGTRWPRVRLDAWVVMPNHLHGIIGLRPEPDEQTASISLSAIIGAFKSLTTNAFARGVDELGWEPFEGRLWQRSFHDDIIRSREHLASARAYIASNPERWDEDEYAPSAAANRNTGQV